MKTLTNKIISVGLGLSMLGMVYGCKTTGMGALGTLMQVSPYSTPDEKALGAVIGTAAQMEHEKEVAREGKPETNINVYANVPRERTQRYDELPLIFTATGGFNTGENYTGIGKQIYHPGEEIYIVIRNPIFKMGENVISYNICLTTGERFAPFNKYKGSRLVGSFNEITILQATGAYEYGKKHGYDTTVWVKVWEVDGVEVGRVKYVVTDKGMENPPLE